MAVQGQFISAVRAFHITVLYGSYYQFLNFYIPPDIGQRAILVHLSQRLFQAADISTPPAPRISVRPSLPLCWLGVGAAVAMGLNVMPSLAAVVCAVTYLSIKSIGREFWALQWDNLIIEACVPAVFMFATPTIVHMDPTASYVPLAARFMAVAYAWMCFRLMFSSGVVKLFSGDVAWANWSALQYHFFSQPIPNWIAWYAHNCVPPTVLRWACGAHFFIEIVAPFFAFFFVHRP